MWFFQFWGALVPVFTVQIVHLFVIYPIISRLADGRSLLPPSILAKKPSIFEKTVHFVKSCMLNGLSRSPSHPNSLEPPGKSSRDGSQDEPFFCPDTPGGSRRQRVWQFASRTLVTGLYLAQGHIRLLRVHYRRLLFTAEHAFRLGHNLLQQLGRLPRGLPRVIWTCTHRQ